MIYDYQCTACRHTFEQWNRVADRNRAMCPRCDSVAERQLSAPTIHPDLNNFASPQWNHQLQCRVKSVSHAEELGKRRGWTAVDH